MKHIKIGNKIFKLASRWRRFLAFFIDILSFALLFIGLSLVVFLVGGILLGLILVFLALIDIFSEFPIWYYNFLDWAERTSFHTIIGMLVTMLVSFFVVLIRKPGTGVMDIEVIGVESERRYSFIRALANLFQPLDLFFCAFSRKRQRLGDMLARTVVVEKGVVQVLKSRKIEVEGKDPEKDLEIIIVEMKKWLSEARQKVDASIEVAKQFQEAYKSTVAQAERCHASASAALKVENEDSAREELGKRSRYLRLAEQCEKHWGDQKQVVGALNNLLEHLQQKVMKVEDRKAGVVVQHKNIDAEAHLRDLQKEIQDNPLVNIGQDATEVVSLAKAAAEMDIEYQEAELEREFVNYAEDEVIDKELAELKEKLQ